jgi:heme A synthase
VIASRSGRSNSIRKAGMALALLVGVQLAAGAINVWLLAPVWLQLVHLFLANLIWIILILLSLEEKQQNSSVSGAAVI